jgi:hypothetical protein
MALNFEMNEAARQQFRDFLVELQTINFQAAKAIVQIEELKKTVAALPWYIKVMLMLNKRKG